MRDNAPNIAVFVVLAAVLTAGWWYVDKNFIPKPERKPSRETMMALAGSPITATEPATEWPMRSRPQPPEKSADELAQEKQDPASKEDEKGPKQPAEIKPVDDKPPTLIELGDDTFYNKVLLTTQGGGVQQVTLTRFEEANRLGREVRVDGKKVPLRLIPGVKRPRDKTSLEYEPPFIDLVPGPVEDPELREQLANPSYVILHYPSNDDPIRQSNEARQLNDFHPSSELADRQWDWDGKIRNNDDGSQEVTFTTELGAPYHLQLKKTFSLAPKQYHVGMQLELVPLPGREKRKGVFRYQIVGAHGLPIEGEWYTYYYRNVMAGWITSEGQLKRSFEDALTIHRKHGGDRVQRGNNTFTYAAVANQYFASAVAIDDTQSAEVRKGMWESVRPTREPNSWDNPQQLFLADVTVRAVSSPIDIDPNKSEGVSHKYLIYNGPIKVSLLKQMTNDKGHPDWEVDHQLVDRYLDNLTLRTLTDYHSPNFFGRLANAIWWSDLVIFFTNLMHSVLGFLHWKILPVWGLNIIMLTVMIRLILMGPSRRQQAAAIKLQAKMAELKPELDKLQEKYKDDFKALNQAKTQLMFKHGINPAAQLGGCLLLMLQMPVLMGLYFCLQESVFFRLESFLWIPNLAAPDELFWWGENIPVISNTENIGSILYLGPYFNILPILSTAVILLQQKLAMPPATTPEQEAQQRMMKIMMMMMAIFFYKIAAGLCIYFVCGGLWALAERQLIPVPKPSDKPSDEKNESGEEKPSGFLGRLRKKMKERVEELQRQADMQSKQQIRNQPEAEDFNRAAKRAAKKKKKR